VQIKKQPPNSHILGFSLILNKGFAALVDFEDYQKLKSRRWIVKKSAHNVYAVHKCTRHGKQTLLRMHRLIAKTPQGYECHHINGNTLDNRKSNLINLTPQEHRDIHSNKI
jgi:hypothetical protein